MRSFALAGLASLASTALALTVPASLDELVKNSALAARDDYGNDGFHDWDGRNCLTTTRAQQVANNFQNLIASYSDALANATLTVDYTDYSDSVNELINGGCPTGPAPLGSATFSSRAAFELGQGGQPAIPFQQLNLWHNCHAVTLRWRSAQSPEEVTGIIVMDTVPAPAGSQYKDLIKTVFSEFNSGAWLVNLGIFKPVCS